MNKRVYRNPKPQVGDIVQFKDVRMDGTINSKHLGMIYNIKGNSAFIQWDGPKKPYNYNDQYGYSVIKIQMEYDVFSIISKVENVKPG